MHSPLTTRTIPNRGKYRARGKPIIGWVIHHGATLSRGNIEAMMSDPDWDLSANYILGDGHIVGVVPEEFRAYTSASVADYERLTVEITNDAIGATDMTWTISNVELHNMARLIADTSRRYGFPINRRTIIGHREIPAIYGDGYSTACPSGIPLDKLVDLAVAYYNDPSTPNTEGEFTVTQMETIEARFDRLEGLLRPQVLREEGTGKVFILNRDTGIYFHVDSPEAYERFVALGMISREITSMHPNNLARYLETYRELGKQD